VENEIKELPPNETGKGKVSVTWKEKAPKGKGKKGKSEGKRLKPNESETLRH
jgi:hypothetical protein